MSYQALARKWRPQTFRDIIGQPTIVRTLSHAIEQSRIHHAYLFSGVRGVGKTTTARILAKALNCVKGPTTEPCNQCSACREITEGIDMDVREIDAATYSKAEDVREIREVMQFQPARDRYRVFIIDEVHSLSGQAWNALLKQIEEPPPHVIFMMATTELQKVPATILSRVQQLLFRNVTAEDITGRIQEICREEGIQIEPQALGILASRGEGSVRDSLSLLDQIVAFSGRSITGADVVTILGISDSRQLARIVTLIQEGDHAGLLQTLEEASQSGRDFKLLFRDLLGYFRNLLVLAGGGDPSLVAGAGEDLQNMKTLASQFEYTELLRILNLLIKDDELVSRSEQQRLAVEIAILKAATLPRLRSVERALAGETAASSAPSRPATPPAPARRAVHTESAAPKAAEVPRPSPARDVEQGELARRVTEEVRKTRKMAASYLDQARQSRGEGDTITFEFDPADEFAAKFLAEAAQLDFLKETAKNLAGRPVDVRVSFIGGKSDDKKQERRISDDPVVKAFAKHLGGEVVSHGRDSE
jgi:DNA polymerase-3 subunit gamma/tau